MDICGNCGKKLKGNCYIKSNTDDNGYSSDPEVILENGRPRYELICEKCRGDILNNPSGNKLSDQQIMGQAHMGQVPAGHAGGLKTLRENCRAYNEKTGIFKICTIAILLFPILLSVTGIQYSSSRELLRVINSNDINKFVFTAMYLSAAVENGIIVAVIAFVAPSIYLLSMYRAPIAPRKLPYVIFISFALPIEIGGIFYAIHNAISQITGMIVVRYFLGFWTSNIFTFVVGNTIHIILWPIVIGLGLFAAIIKSYFDFHRN